MRDKLGPALARYHTFHQRHARGEVPIHATIPTRLTVLGDAVHVAYRSNKWTGKWVNYIHEHGPDVTIYAPVAVARELGLEEIRVVDTPLFVRVDVGVWLGTCLGFKAEGAQTVEAEGVLRGDCQLLTNPAGNALYIAEPKRLLAVIWGGSLDVRPEGICG